MTAVGRDEKRSCAPLVSPIAKLRPTHNTIPRLFFYPPLLSALFFPFAEPHSSFCSTHSFTDAAVVFSENDAIRYTRRLPSPVPGYRLKPASGRARRGLPALAAPSVSRRVPRFFIWLLALFSVARRKKLCGKRGKSKKITYPTLLALDCGKRRCFIPGCTTNFYSSARRVPRDVSPPTLVHSFPNQTRSMPEWRNQNTISGKTIIRDFQISFETRLNSERSEEFHSEDFLRVTFRVKSRIVNFFLVIHL